jgi:hypothetical protein
MRKLCLNGAALRSAAKPLLVFAAVAALLAAVLPTLADRHQAITGDGGLYVRMSEHPGRLADPTLGFRIMMPWLVSVLPGSTELGFEIVTVLSLAITAAVLFTLLRQTLGDEAACWGVVFFLVSGAVVRALRDPYLVDALAFAFVIGAFTLAFARCWLWLALVLAAGVLAKETLLFVLVPAVLLGLRGRPNARVWQLVVVVAAPISVYLLLHRTSLIFSEPGNHSYLADIPHVIPYEREKVGLVRAPIQAVLYSFGPLWLVVAVGYRRLEARWRVAFPYLPVAVVGSLAVAGDWPRLLGYAFPIVIAAAVAMPLAPARRLLLAAAVLLDTAVFEALPSSVMKEVLLLAAFLVGVIAVTGRPTWRRDALSRARVLQPRG